MSDVRRGAAHALALFKAAALATKELGGLTFRIDRPKGYTKKWPNGRRWTYVVDYGYVPRIKGEDGEGLDAFVGDDPAGHLESFQKLRRDGAGRLVPDETKFLLGVNDREREAIYRFYGVEVNARRVYNDWDAVREAIDKFKPKKHPVAKTAGTDQTAVCGCCSDKGATVPTAGCDACRCEHGATMDALCPPCKRWIKKEGSRANPWAMITHEGPIAGEDTNYDHAKAQFKFALLPDPQARDKSPMVAKVTGGGLAPSAKPLAPPKPPKGPEPLPVPTSSKPQVLKLSTFVAPHDMTVPDAGNTFAEPNHNRSAESSARSDLIDRFFREQLDSHKNVVPSGGTESSHGAIVPADLNGY